MTPDEPSYSALQTRIAGCREPPAFARRWQPSRRRTAGSQRFSLTIRSSRDGSPLHIVADPPDEDGYWRSASVLFTWEAHLERADLGWCGTGTLECWESGFRDELPGSLPPVSAGIHPTEEEIDAFVDQALAFVHRCGAIVAEEIAEHYALRGASHPGGRAARNRCVAQALRPARATPPCRPRPATLPGAPGKATSPTWCPRQQHQQGHHCRHQHLCQRRSATHPPRPYSTCPPRPASTPTTPGKHTHRARHGHPPCPASTPTAPGMSPTAPGMDTHRTRHATPTALTTATYTPRYHGHSTAPTMPDTASCRTRHVPPAPPPGMDHHRARQPCQPHPTLPRPPHLSPPPAPHHAPSQPIPPPPCNVVILFLKLSREDSPPSLP